MKERDYVLTSLLKCNLTDLYAKKLNLNEKQEEEWKNVQARRRFGEPLQYILGECEFMGETFKVDKRVLIPRPETEILVESVIDKIRTDFGDRPVSVLDVGTGSGNIAVMIAKSLPQVCVHALDVSRDALELAAINAETHRVLESIRFEQNDMSDFISQSIDRKNRFDVIVSNPPYIAEGDMRHLPLEIKQEPRIALHGGPDGLVYLKKIFVAGRFLLNRPGFVACEIGEDQAEAVARLIERIPSYTHYQFLEDYANTQRVVIAG